MRLLEVVAIATMCALATGVHAQSTQRIRGDVVSVEGTKLEVRTRTGELASITLADQYKVSAVVKASEPDPSEMPSDAHAASFPTGRKPRASSPYSIT